MREIPTNLEKMGSTSSLKCYGKKKPELQMNGSGSGRKRDNDI
jgi:hypothetical protein